MRIRRRATDALPHAWVTSSPTSRPRSPPVPPPSAPSRAPAPRSETAPARLVEPPACEVDPTMCKAVPFEPRRPCRGGNRQEEEKEDSRKATGDEKRGKEDGRSEHENGRPVHVACSTPAAPKREEEQRSPEAEEKSEDSGRVKDEEKSAAMCKKGDGKGWHCKRVAQCGHSLCQYHLDKLRSYGCYSQKKKKKKRPKAASATEKVTAAGVHRQGASQQKKNKKRRMMEEHVLSTGLGVSDSFYYYSGFGPRWGKRRGDRSEDGVKVPEGGASQVHQDRGAAAAAGEKEEEEEEEEAEEGEYDCDGAGRDGRPFKSRALSSL